MAVPEIDLDALEPESVEPTCTFKLGGEIWTVRNADLIGVGILDDAMNSGVKVADFFRAVLIPDDIDEFMELMNRSDTPLTIPRAMKLVELLVEQVTARPTGRSQPSTAGPLPTAATSTAVSPSRATRRARVS